MTRIFSRRRSSALIALLSSAIAPLALGQSVTWTGGGTAANWDNTHVVGLNIFYGNWGNTTSLPGGANDVFFGSGFASGNPFLSGNRSVKSITLTTTSSITFAGNTGNVFAFPTLTRMSDAAGTQIFATAVALSGASTTWNDQWQRPAASSFASGGVGQIVPGSALTKVGTAQVTLGGGSIDTVDNLWEGPTTISAGTLVLNKAQNTDAAPVGTQIVINGGTLPL